MFLARTVQDILEHSEAPTEIIAVIDGSAAGDPVPEDPRVRVVKLDYSIGQRAATNMACRMSTAKYVLKCDAHCAFAQGFDRVMIEGMEGHDDWISVPIMLNLHAFNWKCPNGHTRYQGPSGPCTVCGEPTVMDVVWISKHNPSSKAYAFDHTPHFQYHRSFSKRPEGKGDITETMSLQGSCWMLTRDYYWKLGVCDETFGSWGSMGIEVSARAWLTGGRVVCNQRTAYSHLFRTQGQDFSFPYPLSGHQVEHAKSMARDLLFNNNVDRVIFWGRIPIILLSVLLGLYIFKWGKELFGYRAGVIGLFIYAFMPNIIAHSQLVTMDLGVTAFCFIALYYLWKLNPF